MEENILCNQNTKIFFTDKSSLRSSCKTVFRDIFPLPTHNGMTSRKVAFLYPNQGQNVTVFGVVARDRFKYRFKLLGLGRNLPFFLEKELYQSLNWKKGEDIAVKITRTANGFQVEHA